MPVNYISRAAWGARPPRGRGTFKNVDFIFVHHTTGAALGADQTDDWVRNVQNQHMNVNRWADIGYSFLFDDYGNVFEGRGWNVVGAHTPNFNSKAHAFSYLGNGDIPLPGAAQEALRWLIAQHDLKYGAKEIRGHRQAKATHCPGNWLFDNRNHFRQYVNIISPGAPIATGAPPFPLPVGNWYGRPAKDNRNHSGYYWSGDRTGIAAFQQRLRDRGWGIGVSGVVDPHTDAIVRAFQSEKRLAVDGLVGPITWAAFWTAPIT